MAARGAQGVHTRSRVGANGGSAGSVSRAETRSGADSTGERPV